MKLMRSGAALAGWLFCLCACDGRLDVVDSIADPSAGYLNTGCQCASSDALQPLLCNGPGGPEFDDTVQATRDGNIVAFNLGSGLINQDVVVYWDGSRTRPVSRGTLEGMSAAGNRLLIWGPVGEPGLKVLDPESGKSLPIAIDLPMDRGSLSASGEWVFGKNFPDGTLETTQLARANANTGRVEVLGDIGNPTSNVMTTPDASTVIGFIEGPSSRSAASVPFRWLHDGGLSFSLPGVPPGMELRPEAVNATGTIIVGRSFTDQSWFRWSEVEGYESIGTDSYASRISDDGSVVAGTLAGHAVWDERTFRWSRESGVVLLTPDQPSTPVAMSEDGSVIVAIGRARTQAEITLDLPQPTYVWNATHGTRTLDAVLSDQGIDTEGWAFDEPRALSGDGKVLLGRGTCGGAPAFYRLVLSD